MFEKYQPLELPSNDQTDSARSRLLQTDSRLSTNEQVLGIYLDGQTKAYSLDKQFLMMLDTVGNRQIVILRDQGSAAAYRPVANQPRKFKGPQPNAEGISPPNAGTPLPTGSPELPSRTLILKETSGQVVDVETGSVWDVAGRAQSGELKGWTLEPVDAVVCKWFAWSAEYPQTQVYNQQATKPAEPKAPDAKATMKMVAGSAEFLRVLPKPFATLKAVDAKQGTVTLLLDGEKLAKVWAMEPDAEIKKNGWWGRLEQFVLGERVWV